MIEVVHFQNRYGKNMVGVIGVKEITPIQYEHAQRYAAGLEKPHYSLPAEPIHNEITCELCWVISFTGLLRR